MRRTVCVCALVPGRPRDGRTMHMVHISPEYRHNSRKYLASGYVNNVFVLVLFFLLFYAVVFCLAFGSWPRIDTILFWYTLAPVPECAHTLRYARIFGQSTTTSLVIKWPPYDGNGFAYNNCEPARRKDFCLEMKKTRKTKIVCACALKVEREKRNEQQK